MSVALCPGIAERLLGSPEKEQEPSGHLAFPGELLEEGWDERKGARASRPRRRIRTAGKMPTPPWKDSGARRSTS